VWAGASAGSKRLGGTHRSSCPRKLTQVERETLGQGAGERMFMGIERGESVDAKPGRKKQRLKAAHKRRRTMMQQGKVVARMRVLNCASTAWVSWATTGPKVSWWSSPWANRMPADKRTDGA